MAHRPLPARLVVVALPALLVGLACAGSGAPADVSAGEDEPARQRSLLEATTPGAAKAHAGAPDPAPAPATPPRDDSTAGRLLIYSAITGHVPLEEKPTHQASDRHRSPAEREAARARQIEAEIEEEVQRQEQLPVAEVASATPPADPGSDPAASPLAAPDAPALRELPDSLFASQEVTIPAGRWDNRSDLQLLKRSLDVDEDGRPEEVRYIDPGSGAPVRTEHDLDFDGRLDAWVSYENGVPVVRELDASGDGKSDGWERYSDGRMTARTLDRSGDGSKDTFYRYESGELVEKLSDTNNDGNVDKIEAFSGRRRTRIEEDRSHNGEMDTWTRYEVVAGREVVASVHRDSRDLGKPDIFETYETRDGATKLARKEEDVDGDGSVDVVSTYEDGKLVQRAISDEALSPL